MSEVSVVPESVIRVMPETLANKIAAGEVVQRPASAAKELIENALDAGADQVTVVLKSAGRELVQVIDNGCGMGPADAVACFQRHATSKIRSVEDLERILTLGFRGEALASIAAVAQVELRTKRVRDEAGVCVRVEGGILKSSEPCATPNGTSIAVRNLFFNVPARRNFLKSPATEFKHLVETFQFLALSHPGVGFTLIHDENEIHRLDRIASNDTFEAIRARVSGIFGKEYGQKLIPVEEATSYLSVYGFVGHPSLRRKSRGEQFLFVNGRYVKNRSLEHAVAAAFGDALPEGTYPFFTLFLNLDPAHVDVNVHPTKAEVKFDDERGVYGFMKAVVKKALGVSELTPQIGGEPEQTVGSPFSHEGGQAVPAPVTFPTPRPMRSPEGGASRPASPRSFGPRSSQAMDLGDQSEQLYAVPGLEPAVTGGPIASGATTDLEDAQSVPSETLLWQLHQAYILTQIRSGLMVVDQNAAHERILYERALNSLRGGFELSQQLLFPHTLDFSPADYELLKELLPDLRSLGFDIEFFGGRSVVVRGVPAEIRAGDERSVIEDVLAQYKSYGEGPQLKKRERLARSLARRSAIKHGEQLTVKEMRSLIDQLFLCEMPYACPHGRPTMVKITIAELNSRFGRGG